MIWVRLINNIVWEIIPEENTPNIADFFGEEFAAQCRKAPPEVEQGWVFNPETETFSEPIQEPFEPIPDIAEVLRSEMNKLRNEVNAGVQAAIDRVNDVETAIDMILQVMT